MKRQRVIKLAVLMKALLRSRLWGKPFFLSHLVTTRCNCSCPMCLWRDNSGAVEEMTAQEIGRFYRDSRRNGFIGTSIWGGEPLLRQDLGEILAAARSCNLATMMVTNGYYLQERLGELAPKLDAVIVSLDYANAAQHDQRRGCPGLFVRAVIAVEELRRRYPRVKVLLNCLMLRDNRGSIQPLAELAQELGVSFYVCPVKEETGSGKRGCSARAWQPAGEEERSMGQELAGLKKTGYALNNSYTYLHKYLINREPFRCQLPRIALIVRPDGDVTHCMHRGVALGSVRSQPLQHILTSTAYRELLQGAHQCSRCNNPNIVESSYMWQLKLEPLLNAAVVMLKR